MSFATSITCVLFYMLQLSLLLRGALCISYRALKSAAAAPVAAAGVSAASSRLGGAWEGSIERAEALENLSNEVFGRGNRHLKNVETLTALPEGLHSFPEVCFIGKPGCGKSSLISCLLHNHRLGKAGATAGTTRLLQFFNVGDALLLVDTPGYGGWRGREVGQRLAEQANAFSILFRYLALRNGSNLKRVYWLMESSAPTPVSFQPRDEELLTFLSRERIPFSVVLTKIDRHWRHYAEQQRTADRVGNDGFVHPRHRRPETHDQGFFTRTSLPQDGVARNMQEVYEFLGTDQVPILGVSANRLQPNRSRNLELLQHDIVHYCTQDLLHSEELSFRNMHKLSYAPPTADRIHEIQLRYPVESFVVPENNNMSLARMVEHHEEMKARFCENNVCARRLSAKDVAACHLESVAKLKAACKHDTAERERAEKVRPTATYLFESTLAAAVTSLPLPGDVAGLLRASEAQGTATASVSRVGGLPERWKECDDHNAEACAADVCASRRFRVRPLLVGERQTSRDSLGDILERALDEEEPRQDFAGSIVDKGEKTANAASPPHCAHAETTSSSHTLNPVPDEAPVPQPYRVDAVLLQEQPLEALPLPAMLDPDAHYVTAIDGTPIPRSMISVSVEQLAVSKDDELAHFATKSGAGAYEELIVADQEKSNAGADLFMETSDVAHLPEEVQTQLEEACARLTRSAARKQKERFLTKYVERKRKERSIYMQAEGYMCPWLGRSEGRSVVQGFAGSCGTGKGGAVMRDLKQKGFGGKSYSARTMKNRGRATKKTGFWAA
ncbi:conserved hypothetical protein [Leishmania major strain Friedlin]|uniref:G domain-containing protein n=1 Tax=Leishmania major TaxID=5664 RepID=Q4Q4X0_LEIMA|nr:conserved hypothetical protein [Leishmania major strain Friedlin]7AM2_BV Chain BV, G domain-containing protein [Leishmania tarentolae]CAG9580445.1 50S_ribosome-binding_GTPase_-_putative [Leishmania major strain Friedlin]CAJ08833.1 conserved hypothetical protein [Leishmania major strain Friedlin]|eukprot:XP_001685628.1 conserved hypothetical protein [Leishmania major strain Friedlin]